MVSRRPAPWMRDERGNSSVGWIMLFPLFIAIVFAIVQGGLYYHAQTAAHAAASAGYFAARTLDGDESLGHAAAQEVVARHSDILEGASIGVSRTGQTVTVTVSGSSPSLVPAWMAPPVSQEVSGPTERMLP